MRQVVGVDGAREPANQPGECASGEVTDQQVGREAYEGQRYPHQQVIEEEILGA